MCVGDQEGQKRELGPLELKLQVVVSCWCGCLERILGPFQEHRVLLNTKPSSQPEYKKLSSVSPRDYVKLYLLFVPHYSL